MSSRSGAMTIHVHLQRRTTTEDHWNGVEPEPINQAFTNRFSATSDITKAAGFAAEQLRNTTFEWVNEDLVLRERGRHGADITVELNYTPDGGQPHLEQVEIEATGGWSQAIKQGVWTTTMAMQDHLSKVRADAEFAKGKPADLTGLPAVVPYPRDWSEASTDNIPIGVRTDGSIYTTSLHIAAAGHRGSGKTVLLQSIICSLLKAPNAIVWAAAINGGGLAAPFVYPAITGKVSSSPIDWVAHDLKTLQQMVAGLRMVIDARRASMPNRASWPLLVFVLDNASEVFTDDHPAMRRLTGDIGVIRRYGLDVGVRVITPTSRATADHLSSPQLKLARTRIAFRVEDDAELAYMFGWGRQQLSSADLKNPGDAFVFDGRTVEQVRMWHPDFATIEECVVATAGRRPQLEAVPSDKFRALYENRWTNEGTAGWTARLRG